MKKLVVSLTLAAFAFIPALQADDAKSCDSAKGSCCSEKAKAASTGACCSKKVALKKADATSKGAAQLVQR